MCSPPFTFLYLQGRCKVDVVQHRHHLPSAAAVAMVPCRGRGTAIVWPLTSQFSADPLPRPLPSPNFALPDAPRQPFQPVMRYVERHSGNCLFLYPRPRVHRPAEVFKVHPFIWELIFENRGLIFKPRSAMLCLGSCAVSKPDHSIHLWRTFRVLSGVFFGYLSGSYMLSGSVLGPTMMYHPGPARYHCILIRGRDCWMWLRADLNIIVNPSNI